MKTKATNHNKKTFKNNNHVNNPRKSKTTTSVQSDTSTGSKSSITKGNLNWKMNRANAYQWGPPVQLWTIFTGETEATEREDWRREGDVRETGGGSGGDSI